MAIKFTDRYQSYNYSEHSLTFDSSATVASSVIEDVTGWSSLISGSLGSESRLTNRGGFAFKIYGAGYSSCVLKAYTDTSLNQGNNWITFSFASSAVSGFRTTSRSNTSSGNWSLYIMDDISGLIADYSDNPSTNHQLLASGSGTAARNNNGVYEVDAQISINIETSQLTIYRTGTNKSETYQAGSDSSSLVADGTTVSTAGWSGDLYLYMYGLQSDGSNYPSNQCQPQGFISPIILSNKPIGGQGTV